MQYRRAFIPGASYFFTVVTHQRRPIFASPNAIDTLKQAIRHVRSQRPFTIDAIVVLPDHLHCIWTQPPGDADFATRWRLIKSRFTRNCDPHVRRDVDNARARKRRADNLATSLLGTLIAQRGGFHRHVEYIHYNPVKHGLVKHAIEWPYSSLRRYVDKGLYLADWGCDVADFDGVGSE